MAIVTPFVQVGTYPTRNFCYLRTVIVTAAVYWDFDQELAPHHLIFQHRAGVTPIRPLSCLQSAVFFNKQSQPPIFCNPFGSVREGLHLLGHTFFRSYGVNLPSSFSRVLLKRLRILISRTSVGLRYGHHS